jgi:hypothetical protein
VCLGWELVGFVRFCLWLWRIKLPPMRSLVREEYLAYDVDEQDNAITNITHD